MSDYTREAEMALDMVRLRRELEAVKAERDGLGRLVHDKAVMIMRMEEERDALVAHVERLRFTLIDAKRYVAATAYPTLYIASQYKVLAKRAMRRIEEVGKEAPATSLARLKAISRAEAMEWAAEKADPGVAPWLKALARDYRRQAKKGE